MHVLLRVVLSHALLLLICFYISVSSPGFRLCCVSGLLDICAELERMLLVRAVTWDEDRYLEYGSSSSHSWKRGCE